MRRRKHTIARDMKKAGSKSKRSVSCKDAPDSRRTVSQPERILNFWMTPGHVAEDTVHRWSRWFVPDPEFDKLCKSLFLDSYRDAAFGRLDGWKKAPRSCLALVLLLDQFPRNMLRGTARAFATDLKARELSRHAIESGFDRKLSPLMRMFLYLPLEHSENLDDQLESVRLSCALGGQNHDYSEILKYAEQHLEIIRRFGRFPGRNRALGRQSTQEEMDFLKDEKEM
jgi:uncharacterized protein (DUF924 family)